MEPSKVLLISMPDSFMGFNIAARLPNLGLVSIAGNSNPKESEYGVLDLILHQKDPMKYVKYFLDKFQPDYVGLNSMTFQFYTARKIAKYIKEEYNPDIKVLMGGYHATLCYDELSMPITNNMPEELKKNTCPWCDYFVRGEGEFTLRELIHAEREKLPLRNILGLSWRGEDGKFRHNARRPVADLKTLKRPDRDVRLLKKGYHIIGKPADTVETSRGCVNKCKFCSIRKMYGQGIRYYDVERVIDDIKDAAERGARSILFIDDNITLNVKRLEKICDRIVEEGLDYIEYHTQASAEGLLRRKTLIPKMNKAGFSVVFFGIENVQPKNLNLFNKYIPLQRLKGLVKSLHKNGMISFGGFILGNPDDNEEDINANLKFAKMLNLDFPAFQILTPFPKTEIREEYKEAGLLVNPYDYSKYTGLFGNVKTKYLSAEFLEKEMLRLYYHYYNPIWLLKRFSRLNLLYKYWKYVANIIKKYGKLAISSWNTTMINRLRGKSITQAEDQVIDYFALVREKKRAKPE